MSDNGKASTIYHQGLKIKELEHKNAELTKERDELKAHCEDIKAVLDDLSKLHEADVFVKEPWEMTFEMVNTLLQQTPQQSLANLQAEAIESSLSKITGYEKERGEQNQEIDTLRMQLAACGVAALSNTQESLDKFKNELGDDYYCASVEDCINATQKQIDLHRDLKLCQAKGIDKAVDAFYDSRGCYTSEDEGVVTDFMRGYANQLREQAK